MQTLTTCKLKQTKLVNLYKLKTKERKQWRRLAMMIARVPRTDSTRWKLIQKVCIQAQSMSQSIIKVLVYWRKKDSCT